MPKQLHEIKRFQSGTITTPSDTDIPEDAAISSLNIDAMAEDGVLKGAKKDALIGVASSYTQITGAFDVGVSISNGATEFSVENGDEQWDEGGKIIFNDTSNVTQILTFSRSSGSDSITSVSGWVSGGSLITTTVIYKYVSSNIKADKFESIDINGEYNGVVFDDTDNKFKTIDNLSRTRATSSNLSSTAETHSVLPSMVNNNKELHIGMGAGVNDVPRWCGIISHGQFGGSAPSGLQLKNAKLSSPVSFPNFHKVVSDGTHIYGIEYGSYILYKLRISDYSVVESKLIESGTLPQLSAIALASDNNIWLFDIGSKVYSGSTPNTLGSWYKVSVSTLEIISSGVLTINKSTSDMVGYGYTGVGNTRASGDKPVVTDMIEIGNYMYFGLASGITGNAQYLGDKLWLCNKLTSSFVTGATVQADMRSIVMADGETGTNPKKWELGYTSTPIYAHAIVPPICLIDPKHSSDEYCGVVMEWYKADGSTSLHNVSGQGIRNKDSGSSVEEVGLSVMSVKYDSSTSTDPDNWASYTVGSDTETSSGKVFGIFQSSDKSKMMFAFENSSTSTLTDYQLINAYDHDTTYSDHQLDPRASNTSEDINRGVVYFKNNSSNYDFHIFSGSGVGRWMSLINDSNGTSAYTTRLENAIELELTENSLTSGTHADNKKYYYKASFTYDGYQESPLGDFTSITSTGKQVQIKVNVHNASVISTRVSHINIYMADGASDTIAPTGFYRYVTRLKLDASWDSVSDNANSPDWGSYYTKLFTHATGLGASYEARTGISEVIDDTIPHYSFSTELNNHLFVSGCYHSDIDDTSNYLFKSRPYNYNQFNYINDFLILPIYPTAMASFNNRIFIFNNNNILRIEPNSLYVESSFKGIGCLGQDSVLVTEYGMCFADEHGIYLHDGQKPNNISIPILRGDSVYSWENIDSSFVPKIAFNNYNKSFLITFKTFASTYYTWEYSILKQRWDLQRLFLSHGGSQETAVPKDFILNKEGDLLWNINGSFYHINGNDTDRKSWDWESKEITLGRDTQNKSFTNFSLTGSPSGSLGTNINIKIDSGTVTETSNDEASGYTNFTISQKKGKKAQWILASQTGIVDSLGVVYRLLKANASN